MQVIKAVGEMRDVSEAWRNQGLVIGFVPTMGALHEGHLSLMRIARARSDRLVVSIFVNPTQFGPSEDYASYPRNTDEDLAMCEAEGVDAVFMPSVDEMYPEAYSTYIDVEGLTEGLCGRFRPGHFRGVATVVAKLFNAVRPHLAVFGMKDAQQFFVIKRMTRDLDFGIEIIPGPTIREPDGLAMSSRNRYLSPEERADAPVIYRALLVAKDLVEQGGVRDPHRIIEQMEHFIAEESTLIRIQYIEIVSTADLRPVERIDGEVLIAIAAFLGKARLIDNLILNIR
ncbi:MAG: pantoate--beta-alanine ligase [candidate division WOR-3 bacterium]